MDATGAAPADARQLRYESKKTYLKHLSFHSPFFFFFVFPAARSLTSTFTMTASLVGDDVSQVLNNTACPYQAGTIGSLACTTLIPGIYNDALKATPAVAYSFQDDMTDACLSAARVDFLFDPVYGGLPADTGLWITAAMSITNRRKNVDFATVYIYLNQNIFTWQLAAEEAMSLAWNRTDGVHFGINLPTNLIVRSGSVTLQRASFSLTLGL